MVEGVGDRGDGRRWLGSPSSGGVGIGASARKLRRSALFIAERIPNLIKPRRGGMGLGARGGARIRR